MYIMKKRYCSNCGEEVTDDSKFCTSCGAEIIEEEVETKKKGRPKKEEPKVDVESIKEELRKEILEEINTKEETKEKEEKAQAIELSEFKSKLKIYPIISCIITLILCLAAFGFFYNYYMKHLVIETTKTIKEVTVNENGISDAVEKVYDATRCGGKSAPVSASDRPQRTPRGSRGWRLAPRRPTSLSASRLRRDSHPGSGRSGPGRESARRMLL